jgi:hypothetical protein
MKLKILERLQKLDDDMFITDYAGDIVNLLVNKQKEYRFLYDAQADLYMICDAFDYIHMDMVEEAFNDGWYNEQEYFCNAFTGGFNNRAAYNSYFSHGLELMPIDDIGEDELELISDNVDRDDDYIYPWIYCFGFLPKGSKREQDLTQDGYNHKYEFDFGTVYTRDFELIECKELYSALKRA